MTPFGNPLTPESPTTSRKPIIWANIFKPPIGFPGPTAQIRAVGWTKVGGQADGCGKGEGGRGTQPQWGAEMLPAKSSPDRG